MEEPSLFGASAPNPRLLSPQIAGPSLDSTFSSSGSDTSSLLTQMGSILTELNSLKSEIDMYKGINLSLVDEFRAANCSELADQKMQLHMAEAVLTRRLEKLMSGWKFDEIASSWTTEALHR